MARYLVTGGAGFIGSHLAHALVADGHHTVVLDDLSSGRRERAPASADLVVADIADRAAAAAAAAGVDGVFHLAAVASVERCNREWIASHRTNSTGVVTVFDVARECGAPVVWASSAAVYGDVDREMIDETASTAPLTAYGADKLSGELQAVPAALIHGVRSTALRFFNVYGPGQDPRSPYSGVIAVFADRLRRGEQITIDGDGGQARDFVYVGDVMTALRAAMRRLQARKAEGAPPAADICNVCTGRATTITELAATLAELIGTSGSVAHGPPRAGDIRRSLGDPTRLRALLGVEAGTDLRSGLRRLLEQG